MTETDATRACLDALRARLGPERVVTAEADIASRLVEARGLYQGSAAAVVYPADTEEVAFTVAACAKAGVPVVAQGGNTGLVGGGVPYGGIVLSLTRLDRIREIDRRQRHHDGRGRLHPAERAGGGRGGAASCFPSRSPSEGSCRIGGNLATNAGGTAVLRYGNTRELMLGLEVVLADGRIWNGLKGLRKDNTGYDLRDLFIGSEGTLGIITAAVLKLFPKPEVAGDRLRRLRLAAARRSRCSTASAPRRAIPDRLRVHAALRPRHRAEARGRRRCARSPGDHASYALIELSSPASRAPTSQGRLEAVLGAGDRGRASSRTPPSAPARRRTARSGACARGSPRCRGSRAARSSTTSRCRSRASPSSSRPRRRPARRRCPAFASARSAISATATSISTCPSRWAWTRPRSSLAGSPSTASCTTSCTA